MSYEKGNHLVETPDWVTKVLLDNESFDGIILEPCCGKGRMANVIKHKGYDVVCSDIDNFGYGEVKDLFEINNSFDNIITNPPFGKQQITKKKLLSLTNKKLALLWYVKNIGGEVETKTSKHLKNIYVIPKKINWIGAKMNWYFAWYVWDKDYEGDITIKRIKPEDYEL